MWSHDWPCNTPRRCRPDEESGAHEERRTHQTDPQSRAHGPNAGGVRVYFRLQYILTEADADAGATHGSASSVCAVAVAVPFWNEPSVSIMEALHG